MNLPFILDVAIGLVFIYLILSLLASELQELVATIFQWRAEHLRKSIEIFLAGDTKNCDDDKVVQLVNQIYNNPLIKSINQQAKGVVSNIPRQATWAVANVYRSLGNSNNTVNGQSQTVFGDDKRSGPSYIPSNIFATTLMETLQFPTLAQKLSESRLDNFKNQRLTEIQDILFGLQEQLGDNDEFADFFNFAYQNFSELQANFEQVIWDSQQNKSDLNNCINRMNTSVDKYIELFQANSPKNDLTDKASQRLQFLKKNSFADTEQTISLAGLRPNVREVSQAVQRGTNVYQELTTALKDKDNEAFQNLEKIIDKLPTALADNITQLAQRAEINITNTNEGVQILRQELENHFDSSMERASGVYKRNAKGVALLIGFIIAAATNADAFHMISRLSKDSALRDTITKNAGPFVLQNRNQLKYVDIGTLRSQTDEALNNIALPIGWTDANLEQQISWSSKKQRQFPFLKVITFIPGWIVSGVAIAMGAPFWFDLLGKIINVRNAGKPPDSSTQAK